MSGMWSSLLSTVRRDLGEFVTTVAEDASLVANKVGLAHAHTEEDKEILGNSKYEMYLKDPPQDDYAAFRLAWDRNEHTEVISSALADANHASAHELLVPKYAKEEDFWARFVFRTQQAESTMKLAAELARGDEDDLGEDWGDDESEDELDGAPQPSASGTGTGLRAPSAHAEGADEASKDGKSVRASEPREPASSSIEGSMVPIDEVEARIAAAVAEARGEWERELAVRVEKQVAIAVAEARKRWESEAAPSVDAAVPVPAGVSAPEPPSGPTTPALPTSDVPAAGGSSGEATASSSDGDRSSGWVELDEPESVAGSGAALALAAVQGDDDDDDDLPGWE